MKKYIYIIGLILFVGINFNLYSQNQILLNVDETLNFAAKKNDLGTFNLFFPIEIQGAPGVYILEGDIAGGGFNINDFNFVVTHGGTVRLTTQMIKDVTSTSWNKSSFSNVVVFNINTKSGFNPIDFCSELTFRLRATSGVTGQLLGEATINLRWEDILNVEAEENALLGCHGLKIKGDEVCDTDPPVVRLSVMECSYNPMTFEFTQISSTEVIRDLTSAEVAQLLSPNGFQFFSFSSSINSISIVPNKIYRVNVVDRGRSGNGWNANYRYFHTKPGTHDYAMRNNLNDDGFEPHYVYDKDIFQSPDLWNNIPALGIGNMNHNPDHVTAPNTQGNLLRFNLRNIGCNTAPPENNHTLRLFWTRARTDELWHSHWLYDMSPGGNNVPSANNPLTLVAAGSEITIDNPTVSNPYNANSQPIVLQNIPPGTNYLTQEGVQGTQAEWFPPDPADFNVTNGSMSSIGRPVVCLLAVINDINHPEDPLLWEPTAGIPMLPDLPIKPFVKNSNNVVTRNTMLYDDPNYIVDGGPGSGGGHHDWNYGFGTVWVNNNGTTTVPVTLCVDLINNILPTDFLDYGRIEVGVTSELWSNWVSAGMQEENMTILSPTLLQMTDTHTCIENINLLPNSMEQIGLRFVYDGNMAFPTSYEQYEYEISAYYGESLTPGSNSVFHVGVPTSSPLLGSYKTQPNIRTSVEEDLDLMVYPNPSRNYVMVTSSLEVDSEYSIVLLDMNGKELQKIEQTNTTKFFTHTFNTEGYRAGAYMIQFKSGDKIYQRKVVIVNK